MAMVTWLHLSDIHFSQDERKKWDERIVLTALLDDIEKHVSLLGRPFDFILVSGDVAHGGLPGEYELARGFFDALLSRTGLTKNRLIIVPGNHDVDRGAISFGENAIASAITDRSNLAEVMTTHATRRLILRRLDGFRVFINDYLYGCPVLDDERHFLFHEVEVSGTRIAIMGLDSAFLSQGGEADRARLAISERQAREALDLAKSADLRLAVMHHPFEWLRDFDRRDCQSPLLRGCDFILHGHLHQTGLAVLHSPGADAMVIAAGACYETRAHRNSYNMVALDPATGSGEVHLRCYSDEDGGFWTKDAATYQDVPDGVFPFTLPIRGKRPPPVISATATALSPLDREIVIYRGKAESRYDSLPLAGFSTKLRVPINLTDLYVPLRAVVDLRGVGDAAFPDAREAERYFKEGRESLSLSLPSAFKECEKLHRRGFVILGDPGAGKTTHLKRVLLACCREGAESLGLPRDMVPVFLPLRELRDPKAGLAAFIQAQLDKNVELGTGADFGKRLIERKKLLILLDGLDEVLAEADRREVARWIETALTFHPECRFVVTCRYAGYSEAVRLDAHFLELHIRPLDDDQVETFVRNWYRIVEQGLSVDKAQAEATAEKRATNLIDRLGSQEFQAAPRVYELTANPLLLTNLCLVHRDRGELPKRRAQLYNECIDVLLERWRAAKQLPLHVTADKGRRVLQPAALFMHEQENRTRVSPEELAPIIAPALRSIQWKGQGADEFLRTIRDESGLLTGWGDGTYGFMHLGFQEYLAAREIRVRALSGDQTVIVELAKRFQESWWQEVALLLLALEEPSLFEPYMREVVRTKSFVDNPKMVNACFDDAAQVSLKPFLELVEIPPGKDKALWERQLIALRILTRVGAAELKAIEKKLGAHPSGDLQKWLRERRGVMAQETLISDPGGYELLLIPGGSFWMGSPEEEAGGYGDERPRHEVRVADFHLGRYPVTNEEYGRFLEANPGASKPEYWGDRQYNQPRQPVVGVSWDDAKAYCGWAGLRLPSEAEWEYACRAGTDMRYWSGDADGDLARVGWYGGNSENRLHPVGEKEPNPYGLYDMHGNVWEWVEDDWHGDYKGAPEDGGAWVGEKRAGGRVVRGGSWSGGARGCRSAYRGNDHPGGRDYLLGFRPSRSIP